MPGNHALDSLRMEKRYCTSRELTHDVNPDEAGLHRFVKPGKGDFVGRDALLARRDRAASGEEPYRWRLAYLAVEADRADAHAADGVYANGRAVGLVTSGAYGFTQPPQPGLRLPGARARRAGNRAGGESGGRALRRPRAGRSSA